MATRIYLPSSGSPDVTPSTWNHANQASTTYTLPGVLVKGTTAMTSRTTASGTTNPYTRAVMRYIIGPLAPNQISGTVNFVMRVSEAATGANATFSIAVKIIQSGGADRSVLLAATASDNASSPYEFSTSLYGRRAYNVSEQRPISLTSQTPTDGDYLVIEIGFRSATTTTRNIVQRHGDNVSTDMVDEDGSNTNDYAPWVEFSGDIPWKTLNVDIDEPVHCDEQSPILHNDDITLVTSQEVTKTEVSPSVSVTVITTRFYLLSEGTPPVSYSPPGGDWDDPSQLTRLPLSLVKGNTPLTNFTVSEVASGSTYVCCLMFISPPLKAVTVSAATLFKTVARFLESSGAIANEVVVFIRAVDKAGTVQQDNSYSGSIVYAELNTSLRSLCNSSYQTPYTSLIVGQGERIVIEFGFRFQNTTTSPMSATMNVGSAPANPLDYSNTDTDADYPYFDFEALIEQLELEPLSISDSVTIGESRTGLVGTALLSTSQGVTVGESVSLLVTTAVSILYIGQHLGLLASTHEVSNASNPLTSPAIDTSGATILVVVTGTWNYVVTGVTDSKGNTWHQGTRYGTAGNSGYLQVWYAYDHGGSPLSVGSGHTFSVTTESYDYITLCVGAYNGTLVSADPLDQQNGHVYNNDGVTYGQPGSITPTQLNELLIGMYGDGYSSSTDASVDSPLTRIFTYHDGSSYSLAHAWYEDPNTNSINPGWDCSSNGQRFVVAVASFKPKPNITEAITVGESGSLYVSGSRFYIPSTSLGTDFAAEDNPGWWNSPVTVDNYRLTKIKQDTAFAYAQVNAAYAVGNRYSNKQFISFPLQAKSWTSADKFKFHCRMLADVLNHQKLSISIRVVSGDGTTFRGVLYRGDGLNLVTTSDGNSRGFGVCSVQNSVSMQDGDRLCLELGEYDESSGGTWVYTRIGDLLSGVDDVPETEGDMNYDGRPWLEFNSDITEILSLSVSVSDTVTKTEGTPTLLEGDVLLSTSQTVTKTEVSPTVVREDGARSITVSDTVTTVESFQTSPPYRIWVAYVEGDQQSEFSWTGSAWARSGPAVHSHFGVNNGKQTVQYLRWPLPSTLPAGCTIKSAKLWLLCLPIIYGERTNLSEAWIYGEPSGNAPVKSVATDRPTWLESGNSATYPTTEEGSGSVHWSGTWPTTDGWFEFDVTSIIQHLSDNYGEFSADEALGLWLAPDSGQTDYAEFIGFNGPGTWSQPALYINYQENLNINVSDTVTKTEVSPSVIIPDISLGRGTVNGIIAGEGDDTQFYWMGSDWNWIYSEGTIWFGNWLDKDDIANLRFTLERGIPSGSRIISAIASLHGYSDAACTNWWVYVTEDDDAPAIASAGDRPTWAESGTTSTYPSTEAGAGAVHFQQAWLIGEDNNLQIASLVQHLVSTYGGLPQGSHIGVWLNGDASTPIYYENGFYGYSVSPAQLAIEYQTIYDDITVSESVSVSGLEVAPNREVNVSDTVTKTEVQPGALVSDLLASTSDTVTKTEVSPTALVGDISAPGPIVLGFMEWLVGNGSAPLSNTITGFKFALSQGGTLKCAALRCVQLYETYAQYAIYDDSSPRNLVAYTVAVKVSQDGSNVEWAWADASHSHYLPPGNYWLCVNCNDNYLWTAFGYDGGFPAYESKAQTYGSWDEQETTPWTTGDTGVKACFVALLQPSEYFVVGESGSVEVGSAPVVDRDVVVSDTVTKTETTPTLLESEVILNTSQGVSAADVAPAPEIYILRRLYLQSGGTPPVSPIYSAYWNETGESTRLNAVFKKGDTALTDYTAGESSATSPIRVAIAQFITPPLVGRTLPAMVGRFRISIRAKEGSADVDVSNCEATITIISEDGNTIRDSIYAGGWVYAEWPTSFISRSGEFIQANASRTIQQGDRLRIEIGYRAGNTTTDYKSGTLNVGDAPATPLDYNNTDTDADYPWIDLYFELKPRDLEAEVSDAVTVTEAVTLSGLEVAPNREVNVSDTVTKTEVQPVVLIGELTAPIVSDSVTVTYTVSRLVSELVLSTAQGVVVTEVPPNVSIGAGPDRNASSFDGVVAAEVQPTLLVGELTLSTFQGLTVTEVSPNVSIGAGPDRNVSVFDNITKTEVTPTLLVSEILLVTTQGVTKTEVAPTLLVGELTLASAQGVVAAESPAGVVSELFLVTSQSVTKTEVSPTLVGGDIIIVTSQGVTKTELQPQVLIVDVSVVTAQGISLAEAPAGTVSELFLNTTQGVATSEYVNVVRETAGNYYVSVSENITAAESRTLLVSELFLSTAQSVTKTEGLTTALDDLAVNRTDAVHAIENGPVVLEPLVVAIQEGVHPAESRLVALESLVVAPQEAVHLAEGRTIENGELVLQTSQGVALGETGSVTTALPGTYYISVADGVSLGEDRSLLVSSLLLLTTQAVALGEYRELYLELWVAISEAILNIQEARGVLLGGLSLTSQEQVALGEELGVAPLGISLVTAQGVQTIENASVYYDLYLTSSQGVLVSEVFASYLLLQVALGQSVGVAESIVIIPPGWVFEVFISEDVHILDVGWVDAFRRVVMDSEIVTSSILTGGLVNAVTLDSEVAVSCSSKSELSREMSLTSEIKIPSMVSKIT